MQPKPASCVGCPAFDKGQGYVAGYGPPDATIAIVAHGPERRDMDGLAHDGGRTWRPFTGPAGAKLDRWFDVVNERRLMAGKSPIARASCYVDNVVRCQLTRGRKAKDRPPTKREVEFCTQAHLGPALRTLPNLRLIIALGGPAMSWAFRADAGEQWAGHTQWINLEDQA